MGVVGHAIDHTVVALPLGLGAYVSLALREGPPNPRPRRPSIIINALNDPSAISPGTPLTKQHVPALNVGTSIITRPVVNKYP